VVHASKRRVAAPTAGIRDSLNGATPVITLPAVDVQPPAPVTIGS